MKKKYSKPVAVIESFQLDTGVASCTGDGGYAIGYSQDSCEYPAGTAIYFTAGNKDCTVDVVNPNEFGDNLCYHGYNNIANIIFIAS